MKIKVYGSKASIPFFSRDNTTYGGNTSCFRLDINGSIVVIDCGSGLVALNRDIEKERNPNENVKLDILLGHIHVDHIIGLAAFPPLYQKGNQIRIFTKSRGDAPLASQVYGIFKPPYWPLAMEELNIAEMIEIQDDSVFKLNDSITVTSFASLHDDGTTAFRIEADKTLIYLLDYELDRDLSKFESLVSFCKDADLIIFDATYLPKDIEKRKGWGHSTFLSAKKLAKASLCKKMLLSHYCHEYSDQEIANILNELQDITKKYILARDGMELEI